MKSARSRILKGLAGISRYTRVLGFGLRVGVSGTEAV